MGLVVVAGGFTLDDTVLLSNEIMRGAPGGNVLYAAIGARLWRDSVGLIALIGRDYPQAYIELLKEKGFDTTGITRVDHPNIKMWALHEDNGGRQLIYKLDSGHNKNLDPRIEYIPKEYEKADGLHIAALPFDTQQALIRYYDDCDTNISLDVVTIPGRIDSTPYRHLANLQGISVFLPSIEEVHDIYGHNGELVSLMDRVTAGANLNVMVVKMGTKGSIVYERASGTAYHVPIFKVSAKDTTGAGDSFCGGFAAGWADTGDAVESVIRGTVSASFMVEDFGALHPLDASKGDVLKRATVVRQGVERISEVVY
jgi:sugar/nucleoside kinase (ribokinase family)